VRGGRSLNLGCRLWTNTIAIFALMIVILSNILTSAVLLYPSSTTIPHALAFETQCTGKAFQSINPFTLGLCVGGRWLGHPYHQQITSQALSFLRPDILEQINDGHEYSDFIWAHQFDSAYHFDSCNFDGAATNINSHYYYILSYFNRGFFSTSTPFPSEDSPAVKFGEILHIAQDFYSHTNWVELQRTGNYNLPPIIDSGKDLWLNTISPYRPIKDDQGHDTNVMIVENNPPPGYTLSRNGHIVTVTDPNGKQFGGLFSGVADKVSQSQDLGNCPQSIALGHWDPYYKLNSNGGVTQVNIGSEKFRWELTGQLGGSQTFQFPSGSDHVAGIDKDDPSRVFDPQTGALLDSVNQPSEFKNGVGYPQAYQLAIQQAQHEWCRLIDLVNTHGGPKVLHKLFSEWVNPSDTKEAFDTCNIKGPRANAGPNQSVNAGNPVFLDGSASKSQISGDTTLSYSWRQTSGPPVTLLDANSENPAFIAPKVDSDPPLIFNLTVTDALSQAASATVTINDSPIGSEPQSGSTFTVISDDDRGGDVCDGTHCSLREAINKANESPGRNTIVFDMRNSTTIKPISDLPRITNPVVINGSTQPRASPGHPLIEIDGRSISTSTPNSIGLVVSGGHSVIQGLVINHFPVVGIALNSNGENVIQGSFLGTDVSGQVAVGSTRNTTGPGIEGAGIEIRDSSNNIIGGTSPAARNVISGNNVGIVIANRDSTGNHILGNYIGPDASGRVTVGNNNYGILISDIVGTGPNNGASNNVIGGIEGDTPGGQACTGSCNVISGNGQNGVDIVDGANGNLLLGNYIGTGINGESSLRNSEDGVFIISSSNNVIGGATPSARNIISSNSQDGILILRSDSIGNRVIGNLIGTDSLGTRSLGNGGSGVDIQDSGRNQIGGQISASDGGTCSGACNTISGNGDSGIIIGGTHAVMNLIQGNYIGTSLTGMDRLPNLGDGIILNALHVNGLNGTSSNTTIGGDKTSLYNLISGNSGNGVDITSGTNGTMIQGNYIGTNPQSTTGLGNSKNGLLIKDSSNNSVGGNTQESENIISANGQNGVEITGQSAMKNSIRINDIHGNNALGIDLGGDGVTPNHNAQNIGDTGPNDLMNYPDGRVFYDAVNNQTTVSGTLNSTNSSAATVDFYANDRGNPSGFGEGQKYLTSITPDSTGSFMTQPIQGHYPFVTATTTDKSGSTSEFSAIFRHIVPPVADAGSPQTVVKGDNVTLNGIGSYDPDGRIVSYNWEQINGPVQVALQGPSGNNVTGPQVSFIAPDTFVNTVYIFRLTVTDNDGASNSAIVAVTVTPEAVALDYDQDGILNDVDTKPRQYSNDFSDITPLSIGGTTTGTIIDRGGLILIVSKADDPAAGITVNADAINFTKLISTTTPAPARVSACNGAAVVSLNLTDVVDITCHSADISVKNGTVGIQYNIHGGMHANTTLSSGNTLLFDPRTSLTTAPITNNANVTIFVEGGKVITLAPGESKDLVDPSTIKNLPPVAIAGTDQIVNEGTKNVTLDGTASYDPDGKITSYLWRQVSGPNVTLRGGTGTGDGGGNINSIGAITKFDAPFVRADAVLRFNLTVTDNDNATSTQSVSITLKDTGNQTLLANAGADQSVDSGTKGVTLDGSTTTAEDGTIPLTYMWQQISGTPMVGLGTPNSHLTRFDAPIVNSDKVLTFKLTVTDHNIQSGSSPSESTDTVKVAIRAPSSGGSSGSTGEQYIFYKKWGTQGSGDGQFNSPDSVAIDHSTHDVYISDTFNSRIEKFDSNGTFIKSWGSTGGGNGQLCRPSDLAVSPFAGHNIYVVDNCNNNVQEFTSDGSFIRTWGSYGSDNGQFGDPEGVAIDPTTGNVFVADAGNNRIEKFTENGTFISAWGTEGSGNGQFEGPEKLSIEPSTGYVYVVDAFNNRVQKFDNDGTFIRAWTVANEPINFSPFNELQGIAIEPSETGNESNIFVTDSSPHVEKFTDKGQSITKWGSYCAIAPLFGGLPGLCVDPDGISGPLDNGDGQFAYPVGIAVDHPSGKVYVVDSVNNRVQVFSRVSGQNITRNIPPIANAGPDQVVNETSRVTLNGNASRDPDSDGIINYSWKQVAGPQVTLEGLCCDLSHQTFTAPSVTTAQKQINLEFNLTVTDYYGAQTSDLVNVTVKDTGVVPPVAGAIIIPDYAPLPQVVDAGTRGVILDANGGSYVPGGGTIKSYLWRPVSANPQLPIRLNGTNTAAVKFDVPNVAYDSILRFNLTVTSSENATASQIVKVGVRGNTANAADPPQEYYQFVKKWGTPGSGNGQLGFPQGLAIDSSRGAIYVADTGNNRIEMFSTNGTFIKKWGTPGSGNGQFNNPSAIAVDPSRGFIYVADSFNYRIEKFNTDGTFINTWGSRGFDNGQFGDRPSAIAVDLTTGNIYVHDFSDGIQKFDSNGKFITRWFGGVAPQGGVAIDSKGFVYVSDQDNHRISKYDSDGLLIRQLGSCSFFATSCDGNGQFARFGSPTFLSTDSSDNIFAADPGNNRLQKFTSSGVFITKRGTVPSCTVSSGGSGCIDPDGPSGPLALGDGQFAGPSGIAFDASTGKVYVADQGNGRIQVFSKSTTKTFNVPPVANAGQDQIVNEHTSFVLNGSASKDPDGGIVRYSWKQVGGDNTNTVALSCSSSVVCRGVAPYITKSENNTMLAFNLTVTDNDGVQAYDIVHVTIRDTGNIPPVAVAGAGNLPFLSFTSSNLNNPFCGCVPTNSILASINAGTVVNLFGDFSFDPDNQRFVDFGDTLSGIASYLWKQIAGPNVNLTGTDTSDPFFTAPYLTADTKLTFNFTVTDYDGAKTTIPVNVLVYKGNTAPLANAGSDQTVNEGTKSVILNGTKSFDPDGSVASYSWTQITPALGGQLQPIVKLNRASTTDNGASVKFDAPFIAQNSTTLLFKLTVTDNRGAQSSNLTHVTLKNVGDLPPVVNNQTVSTPEQSPTNITLTGSDPDFGDILTFSIITNPTHGNLTGFNPATGHVTYVPDKNYNGSDSFTFKAKDIAKVDSNIGTIKINPFKNVPPVAQDQSVTTTENKSITITLRASDLNKDSLTFSKVTNPLHGSLSTLSSHTATSAEVTYTPLPNYNGTDSFTFKANDGKADSTPSTVNIRILGPPPNSPPIVSVQTVKTNQNISLPIFLEGRDPDGEKVTFFIVNNTMHGNLTHFDSSTGSLTYVPTPGFVGTDSFTFKASDGKLNSTNSAQVIIIVNTPPTAYPQNATVLVGYPVNITLRATDPDKGEKLTFSKLSDSGLGDLGPIIPTGPNSANISYTFDPSKWQGTVFEDSSGNLVPAPLPTKGSSAFCDRFTFEVSDGTFSKSAIVTINPLTHCTIFPKPSGGGGTVVVNVPPIVYDQRLTIGENRSVVIPLKSTNVDGNLNQTLRLSILSSPSHGTLSAIIPKAGQVNSTVLLANVTYTPNRGFNGTDSFTYKASDGIQDSNTGTVTITIPRFNLGIIGGSTICSDPNDCKVTDANIFSNGGGLFINNSRQLQQGQQLPDPFADYNLVPIPLPITNKSFVGIHTAILNVASEPKSSGGQGLGCTTDSLSVADKSSIVSYMTKSGGKLIILDPECKPSVDYTWLPKMLQFTTVNPGSLGAHCPAGSSCGATVVENNKLASNIAGDPYETDLGNSGIPKPGNPDGTSNGLCATTDACGDANVMVALGSDLCKTIDATTASGATGTVLAYSKDGSGSGAGRGMLLYNGFDMDDATQPAITTSVSGGINAFYKLLLQELRHPWNPSGLQCKVPVANHPPVANAGLDQTVNENTTNVVLNGTASTDPDAGDRIVAYYWKQTSGPHVTLSNSSAPITTFTAPSVQTDTKLSFNLTVTDNHGLNNTSPATVLITVKHVNIPPIAIPGPFQTVTENTTGVKLDGSKSHDPDGIIKSYMWKQVAGPLVVLSGANSSIASFVAPSVSSDTTLKFNLTVTDNDNVSSSPSTTSVLVKNVNIPPIANAGINQTVNDNSTNPIILDGTKSHDPDGTIKSYHWAEISGSSSDSHTVQLIGANTSKASFNVPHITKDEALTFELTISDNDGATSTANTSVLIKHVNLPPVAVSGPSQTVNESKTVTLNGTKSSDPDGTIQSYIWTQTVGPKVNLTSANTATPSFVAPHVLADTTLTFNLKVTDNQGANSTNSASTNVIVKHVNVPPIANAGANQTVNENTTVVKLDGSKSIDPDSGKIASYDWIQTSGPTVKLNGSNTATPTFTAPSVKADTTMTFKLTVTDSDGGASSSVTTNVLVKRVNILPTAVITPANQTVNENTANIILDGSASSDKDGTIKSYSWTQTSGPSVSLTGENTAKATFAAPSVAKDTTLTFKLAVTDNDNATSAVTTNVLVRNVNIPPIANAGTNQTVNENTTGVTLSASKSYDPDGRIVSYLWTQTSGPSVVLSNPNSATTTFTAPSVTKDTSLTFSLTVKDDGGANSNAATATVLVKNVNLLPIANAGANQTVNENTTGVKLDGTKSFDRDGTITSYSWTQPAGPTVALTGANTATPTFTAPSVTKDTTLTFKLTVTDNDGASSSSTTNVLVKNVNISPVANAGTNQTVNENTTGVKLDGSKSFDGDGTITSYNWQQTSGPLVTLSSPNSVTTTFTAPSVTADTTLTFKLIVTDNDGASSSSTSNVLVKNVNLPPVANAGADQTVNEGTANVKLDGTKSYDPDKGDTIASYSWTQTSGPTVALTGANTATPAFTAPQVNADTTLTFSLKVTDNHGAASTNTATTNMFVKNVNQPPIAKITVLPSSTVTGGTVVTLDGSGSSDPDGGSIASYQWVQTAGSPTITLAGANTAKATFTAPSNLAADTTYTFKLTVTDNDGPPNLSASTTANVLVTVQANIHPGTIGYWKNHQAVTSALLPVTLGNYIVDTWAKASNILNSAAASNVYEQLAAQLLSTKLDIKNGSPTCTNINNAISQADVALTTAGYNGPGTTKAPSGSAKSAITSLVSTLDNYNNNGCNTISNTSTGSTPTSMITTATPKVESSSIIPIGPTTASTGSQTNNTTSKGSISQPIISNNNNNRGSMTVGNTGAQKPVPTQQHQQYPYPYLHQYQPSYPYMYPSQHQQPKPVVTPIANPGLSQTAYENMTVVLNGRNSYDPNLVGGIAAYQWTQLPTNGGVPVALIGGDTATPYFIAPKLPYDNAILAFSLRVMDNHGVVSNNPAVVYVMVKHIPSLNIITNGPFNGGSITPGVTTLIPPTQHQQQQQPYQPIVPNTPNIVYPLVHR
jgi:K319-like protein/Big-like domain-containing protein/NHL repeat-containing protein/6-bladed beta-propeller protein